MSPQDSLTIRPVRSDEYSAAGELIVEAYRSLGDVEAADYLEKLRDVAARAPMGEVLVADMGGQLVGCVTYVDGQTALSEGDDPDAGSIRMLGVSKHARGRGVGEALVAACIDRAVASGRQRVRLTTRTTMKSAQRIYERFGFRRDPDYDRSTTHGMKLMGYVLDLDSATRRLAVTRVCGANAGIEGAPKSIEQGALHVEGPLPIGRGPSERREGEMRGRPTLQNRS